MIVNVSVDHTRTYAHAHWRCLMNWLDGGARAPDMSKGKGNHCKSHSVTCASFWKKNTQVFLWPLWFPPHFGSGQTLLHTHHPFLHLRVCFFPPLSTRGYSFLTTHFPTKGLLLSLFPPTSKISETPARVRARLERRSGDEDRFPAYLSDLDWNSVRVR